jgi:hypothetical protein
MSDREATVYLVGGWCRGDHREPKRNRTILPQRLERLSRQQKPAFQASQDVMMYITDPSVMPSENRSDTCRE